MAIATSTDIRRLQLSLDRITDATTILLETSLLLREEMRKVDEHNLSDTAHPDLRGMIQLLLPTWDIDGSYTGPISDKLSDRFIVGIEFLDEEDMLELESLSTP